MQFASEKKLINIFKIFVQKAIVPQIKKFQGSLVQWNRFASLLIADNLNIIQLQSYVDNLSVWGTNNNDKLQVFSKKNQADIVDTSLFKPSQSFGGQRTKINILNFGEEKPDNLDVRRQSQRDQSLRNRVTQNNLNIWYNLQKLVKSLEENQTVIDNIAKQNNQNHPNRMTRQSPVQQTNPSSQAPITNGYSHSYNFIPTQNSSQTQILNSQNHQHQSHSQPHSQPHSQSSQSFSQPYIQTNNYVKNYF